MENQNSLESVLGEQAAMDVQRDAQMEPTVTGGEASLSEVLGSQSDAGEGSTTENAEQAQQQKEPGYVQSRIQKALAKQEAELTEKYNRMLEEKLRPLQEAEFERQADSLVASGEFKSKERALEYVKLKGGVHEAEKPKQQRAENGQLAPKEDDAAMNRANELLQEAKTIQKTTGVDMMEYFKNDPFIKENIASGKWDFSDAYQYVSQERKKAPQPVRSSNGVEIGKTSFSKMSSKDLNRVNEYLEKGGKIDMR